MRYSGELGICLLGVALGTAGCSEGYLLEARDPSPGLLEHDIHTVSVRCTDTDGLPVGATSIRFKPEGDTNGALLDSNVGVTDDHGWASVQLRTKHEAAFLLTAQANGAANKLRISVSVARDAGGRIAVALRSLTTEPVIETEVIVSDDIDCGSFDVGQPPPATTDGVQTTRRVGIEPGNATNLLFRGLSPGKRYSVLAIGYAGDQRIGRACEDDLVITAEMVATSMPRPISLDLVDEIPLGGGLGLLRAMTKFKGNLGLSGLAGWLKSMAGGSVGPADYVMGQIAARSADSTLAAVLAAYRTELARQLAGPDGPENAARLLRAAKTLTQLQNIRLESLMGIDDETEDGVISADRRLTHSVRKLHVELESSAGQLVSEGFDLTALAPADYQLFGQSRVALQATAPARLEGSRHIVFGPHKLSIPIADVIAGHVLQREFGDAQLERVVGTMIHCDRAGLLVADFARRMKLHDWKSGLGRFIEALIKGGIELTISSVTTQICQEVVRDVLAEAQRRVQKDMGSFRADQNVIFEGSADLRLLQDNHTIDILTNGNWVGVGTFEATR